MTEYSLFWTTSGNGDGVVTGYTPEQLWLLFRAMFGGDGAALDYQSELAPTLASNTATVAAGAALVGGIPYTNSADADVDMPAPTNENRRDLLVLRANWQTQTVRAARVAGTEGSGAYPSTTQQAGGVYEVEIGRAIIGADRVLSADLTVNPSLLVESVEVADGVALEVAAGAVLTLEDTSFADTRQYLQAIATGGATTTLLADGAISGDILVDGAATNAKLADMAEATLKGRAVGAGTGDPADLTAAQLVDIVETADGSGSGLDADTVDGIHASGLAGASHTHAGYSAANHTHSGYAPASHVHGYAAASHSHAAADLPDNITNAKLATMTEAKVKGRPANAGSGDPVDLTAAQVIDILETADGHGSGLDADTLDTLSPADFAVPSHTHGSPLYSSFGVVGATGAIDEQVWGNLVMVSCSLTMTATGVSWTSVGYNPPDLKDENVRFDGVSSAGNLFWVRVYTDRLRLNCPAGWSIGEVFQFTVAWLT